MATPEVKTITGQESYILRSDCVEAAVTRQCAMLAPVTFCRDTSPVQPYAIAPWAEETIGDDMPPLITTLRGDFICSAFGGNDDPVDGRQLPPHGETANCEWTLKNFESNDAGECLSLSLDMPIQGGRCDAEIALVNGHNVVYGRHAFSGVEGPINPGHHATLRFPDREGAARLSFSRHVLAHTFVAPTESPVDRGYSWLRPDTQISDLADVPCIDGSTSDLTRYPARRGFEDIAIICADPSLDVAWSAVTFADEGYIWFSLRDPKRLPSTLLWMSNGGRHYEPWNGRHINTMGVEDMTGFYHIGLAASADDNALSDRGIVTCHRPAPGETLTVPYIQGVASAPGGFDRVADILIGDNEITLIAESGVEQTIACCASFVKTGELAGLI